MTYDTVVQVVAAMLVAGGIKDVYTTPPAASLCAEPVVVVPGPWDRESRRAEGERAVVHVDVLVVRECLWDALVLTSDIEDVLWAAEWGDYSVTSRGRVCGLDTRSPELPRSTESRTSRL